MRVRTWIVLGLLITAPLQAAIAARLPRQRFVPVMYLFLVANMLIFWFLQIGRAHV